MTDERPDPSARDGLDEQLREHLVASSEGKPGPGLEERILARVSETRQRRRWVLVPARWAGAWPTVSRVPRALALGGAGVAIALAGVLVATTLIPPAVPSKTSGGPGPTPVATVEATDGPASNAPHVVGTCPVTPMTRLAGGTAPEVDVSGLRWRWGGVPWVAGVDEKVVWLPDDTTAPEPRITVVAVRLDLPILDGGQPTPVPGASGAVYAALVDPSSVSLLRLPQPGCWLLTATWSMGASSVVVAVNPASGAASSPRSTPGPIVASQPVTACPASLPSTTSAPQGWPGRAIEDGPFRWLLPPTATWIIGGTGDKLVLDSQVGWAIGEMRVIAIPLAEAAGVGWLRATVVRGDIPPGFGGGTMGIGVTLPTRDCWAFVFVDPDTTSTVVADLRH